MMRVSSSPISLILLATFALVSVCLSLAQNATTPSQPSGAHDYSFSLPPSQIWLDTNIDLNPGDVVHITGAVLDCEGPKPFEKAHVLTSSAPVGVVVAKLQPNAKPVSATPDAEFSVVEKSHLYLGVNGWHCSGNVPARVGVRRGAAEGRNP
jgi:hypothetical protein